MVKFITSLQKFEKNGEKTNWTYIMISSAIANTLNPNTKKSFRVKGKIDSYDLHHAALLPYGNGDFILPINAAMRKVIRKSIGQQVSVQIALDNTIQPLNPDLVICINDAPELSKKWHAMIPSHKKYYSNWVSHTKSLALQAQKIACILEGLALNENIHTISKRYSNKRKKATT